MYFIAGLYSYGKSIFLPVLLILLLISVELTKNLLGEAIVFLLFPALVCLFYTRGKGPSVFKSFLICLFLYLSTFVQSSNLLRYKHIAQHIPFDLYQEPITLTGKIENTVPASAPNVSEIKLRGFMGNSNKIELYKILLPAFPGSKMQFMESGAKIVCKVDASNLRAPNNSLANIIDLYKRETPFQFYLTNKTGEHYCRNVNKEILSKKELTFNNLSSGSRSTLALLYASCLGEGGQIETWMTDLFKNTGLYHLLVVSGFHLGLLLILSGAITKICLRIFPSFICKLPEKSIKSLIGIVLTIFFLSLCEAGKPLVRSAIIAFCMAFSVIFNRQQGIVTSLIWSLVILTVIYPFCIFEAGVQLSYGAICGVIIGSRYAARFKTSDLELTLSVYSPPSILIIVKEFFIDSFFCSLGAFVFVSPIQYYWFETFSLYSLLFNILFAVPFSYLIVLPGFFVLIFIWASPSLGVILLNAHSFVVTWLIDTINYLWNFMP